MKTRLIRNAFIAMIAALPALAQAPAKVDLTGKWQLAVVTQNGTSTPTVSFQQKGDSITGHYSSQLQGEVDFRGVVKDKTFSFQMTPSVQGQTMNVTYTGTIESADSVKGTVDISGFGTSTFTGTRQKP